MDASTRNLSHRSAAPAGQSASCGILLLNEYRGVLVARAGRDARWDVPSRPARSNESPLDAALRVTRDASGLDLGRLVLEDLGVLDWHGGASTHLFAAKLAKASVDPAACICSSNYVDCQTGRTTSEIEAFAWVDERELADYCDKDLHRALARLLADGLAERLPLQAWPTGGNP